MYNIFLMYHLEPSGTQLKGASIKARLDYLEEEHGPETLREVLGCLPEGERSRLENGVLPSTWYPLELHGSLDGAIASVLDPMHPVEVFRVLGRASADRNLNSFHRIFLQGRDPKDVLASFPSIRRTNYSDGEASYQAVDETHVALCVSGASGHTVADCASTAGYFERAIELLGGSSPTVELSKCRERGDPVCEFLCSWH